MATRLVTLSIFVATILIALHQTTVAAQELHVVGDSLGWIVPPGGPIAYATWASLQTFHVGDILMFNFTTGEQDVAMVTKEAYDTCNSTNPILLQTTGPVNITLASVGLHYFIGTMDRHCFLGQKLTVDVTGASGPTTSPASTPPPPPPSPVVAEPPRAPMTYVVGDALGWIVPPGGPIAYSTWASGKTFFVGDTLVFNFENGTQDVAEVTKAAYDSCDTTNPTTVLTNSPVSITLSTAGDYFFTSTYSRHCYLGQKLAITVVGTTSGPTSSPAPPPPSTPVPAPPRAPVTYVVGDKLGWIVPPGGPIAYSTWAYDKTFYVGDTLVFNFENGTQDVAEVTKAAYDSCDTTNPTTVLTNSPVSITLTTAGDYFFTSTYSSHCYLGQKLAITVVGTTSGPTSSPAPPPPSTPVPAPPRAPVTYVVGDKLGWIVPPGGPIAYSAWAYDKTFFVGDTLLFNFTNGTQDVAEVTEAAYNSCNTTTPGLTLTTSPAKITLTTAGSYFFTSTYPSHCFLGQKLAINVTATSSPTYPPGSIAEPPSNAPSPSAGAAPIASATSSAPSTAAIGLSCAAFLSVVTTFLV
ncbi:uncharacterized protein LOC131315910 [Rhododendron vialii]|uniref:uncharacterized protein LOC131315910 n=1 Tax=Rhododendron vialii TaxID=182163 RepID=UPI00265FE8AC|nr:uncharacterized protein LOC131315910 [Rhododendron vialii]